MPYSFSKSSRKFLWVVGVVLVLYLFRADILKLLRSTPYDYEECIAEAKGAATQEAVKVLVNSCKDRFPARRSEEGGYVYTKGFRTFRINGPFQTKEEQAWIDQQYEKTSALDRAKEEVRDKILRETHIIHQTYRCATTHLCWHYNVVLAKRNNNNVIDNDHAIIVIFIRVAVALTDTKSCPDKYPSTEQKDFIVRLAVSETTTVNFEIKNREGYSPRFGIVQWILTGTH